LTYEKFRYLTIPNFIYFKTPLFAFYKFSREACASHTISYININIRKIQLVLEHFRKRKGTSEEVPGGLFSVDPLAVVELGKAAFAGFPEPMIQIHAGFLHGPADHVVADVTGAGQEIA